jgi:hypothetical protein
MKRFGFGRMKPLVAGRRLTRTVLLIGVAGATAGALLFGAQAAMAAQIGTDPTAGTLTFTDATTNLPVTSGSGTELLKWNTSDACPSPNNSSAIVVTIDPDTNLQDSLASLSASGPGPYSGTEMDANVETLFKDYTDGSSDTFELVVVCSSGAGGTESSPATFVYYQYAYIIYNPTANTWTYSATGAAPQTATSTALTSTDTTNPTLGTNTADTDDSVTFTATVADSDSTTPAGTVTFQSGGSNIGTEPVTVGALSGGGFGASVTTSFSTAGPYTITATFTPSSTSYATSSASLTETVEVAGSIVSPVSENVSVPSSGTITVTVDTSAIPITGSTGSSTATGDFGTQSPTGANSTTSTAGVQIADSRNTYPGWYVTGQTSNFTGTGSLPATDTISGNQLGWTPNTGETFATSGTAEVTLGSAVTPASPGLGTTAAMLFSAPAGGGNGTFDASALLTLDIPTGAAAGSYTGTLTITAVTSAI